MECVLAKLSLRDEPRRVQLELSLEYLVNPLVDSPAQAREILSSDVLIESSAGHFTLHDFAGQVVWEEVDDPGDWAPLAGSDHDSGEEEHRMVVGRLDLSDMEADSLNLHVSDRSLQAVVFWVDEEPPATDFVRRVILVAGDRSMAVGLPARSRRPLLVVMAWTAVPGAILLAIALSFPMRRETR